MLKSKLKNISPYVWILFSFFGLILIGGFLLSIPISTTDRQGTSLLDGMFIATSAVCVTGLSILDISTKYSLFGKSVLIILIQIGALGVVTMSSFLILIFSKKISYNVKKVVQEDMNVESIFKIQSFLKKVVIMVLSIEAIGSIFLFFEFNKNLPVGKAMFYSIFHSVSAFSNAGFSLFSDNLESFKGNILINVVISVLVIAGGIGFATLINLYSYYILKREKRLFLTTKIVLKMSIMLLFLGMIVTFIFEFTNAETIGRLSLRNKILVSFFQSMTTRTAGFNTVSMVGLRRETILFYIFLMFIGASPGSTGGGIKTTTIGVILLGLKSILSGSDEIEVEKRSISWTVFHRAIVIVIISLLYISLVLFLLVIIESDKSFIDLLFETVSAFGTVGLSRGLTGLLKDGSKILIMITMFIGRVGPLTVALTMSKELIKINKHKYPKENILIG